MPAGAPADDRALHEFLMNTEPEQCWAATEFRCLPMTRITSSPRSVGACVITLFAADATAPILDLVELLTRQQIPCPRSLEASRGSGAEPYMARSAALQPGPRPGADLCRGV